MAASPRQIAQQMARRYLPNPRDQQIFMRQMGAEANFQDETSSAGAQGYAQIMPATAQSWGVSNPHDPVQAFRAAASHMAGYLHQYGGSWAKALTAYNAGPGRVGGPLPAETQSYIQKILGGGDVRAASGMASSPSAGLGALQTVQTPTFDERAFKQAQRRFALGQLLAGQGQEKGNPLFAAGLVTTTAPNAQDFSGSKTTVQRAPSAPGVVASGRELQLPTSFSPTHQTSGLPNYPAIDVFGKPGQPVGSPISGTVVKLSGRDPSAGAYEGQGGPFGWSVYVSDGQRTYFLTHFGSRNVQVGQKVTKGQVLGTVGHYPGATPSHIHVGLHSG